MLGPKKKTLPPGYIAGMPEGCRQSEVVQKHVLDYIQYMGSEKGHSMLFLECIAEVHYKPQHCNKPETAMTNGGHVLRKVAHLGPFHFRDWPVVVSRDALHQQKSLNPCSICIFLKVTLRLKAMPPVQKNHGRSVIENAKNARQSTFTRREAGRRGGGCDWEGSHGCVKSICTETLYKTKDREYHLSRGVKPRSCKFGRPWRADPRGYNVRHQILAPIQPCQYSQRNRHWTLLTPKWLILRLRQVVTVHWRKGDDASANLRIDVPRIVSRRMITAKCWWNFTFLATLAVIEIKQNRDYVIDCDRPDDEKIFHRRVRWCTAVERLAESSAIGKPGAG